MKVLVAYDGSRPAQQALEYAVTHYGDEEITLLRVIEMGTGSLDAGFEILQERLRELRNETATEMADSVRQAIQDEDVEFEIETAVGQPAREILEFAEDNDMDLVIVGNHGRSGIARVLLGSVAETVVRRSPTPVIVIR